MSYYRNQIPSGAAEGLKKKQQFIQKSIDRKEKAIMEFAIRRDAAMFASVTAGAGATREKIAEEYDFWVNFFQGEYSKPTEPETDEEGQPIIPMGQPLGPGYLAK